MLENFEFISLSETDSTQIYAKRLFSKKKLKHGLVITAEKQTAGVGRYDRKWESPEGNLYFTLVLKPTISVNYWSQLSYAIGVSIGEAILLIDHNLDIKYKWVNDIMLEGKKVAGILLENLEDQFLLIGIGVNLIKNQAIDNLQATCLSEHSNNFNKDLLLDTILRRIKMNYEVFHSLGFEPLRNLWLKRALNLGSNIKANFADHSVEGRFLGIDAKGRLELFSEGEVKFIDAAEVYFG